MKTNKRIALATLGALCMLSSCTLDDQMAIPTPVWEGEFKVQMINGSTSIWAPARNLITYRTGHPLTFSLATGLRITLGNQK